MSPKLSICIATYRRAGFIEATLDSIVRQLTPAVELLVVDGASPDETEAVMLAYTRQHPEVRYVRKDQNGGVDADFDHAVSLATGDYCWLMTDDDLMTPDAIATVLRSLEACPDLLIVNASTWTADFSARLAERQLEVTEDRHYGAADFATFFREVGGYLSFIGAVVIRRDVWRERERERYYGSLFIHVGVVFQAPLDNVTVLERPLLRLRQGNAMWTARSFEIWMFLWPGLVWSFDFSVDAKRAVTPRHPFRRVRTLLLQRGCGAFDASTLERFLGNQAEPWGRTLARLVAGIPIPWANVICGAYCAARGERTRSGLYSLGNGPHATQLVRGWARRAGLSTSA